MQLNVEQRKLIQARPNGHMLIKGVAGSGKTTVAVNRIPFLLNHYCFADDDRILMVTYNKTLIGYIQYLYKKAEDEEKIEYLTLLGGDNKDKIDIVTIDSIMYKYFITYKKANNFKLDVLMNNKEKASILAQCISEISKKYSNVNVIDQKNLIFLLDEIDWIKSCNYLEVEEYQNTDRIGRMIKQNTDSPQKLMKNSETRSAIFELMLLYNDRLRQNGYIEFKDMALLSLEQAKRRIETTYTHIIIDESQDLTRVQFEFLKLLFKQKPYSSFVFVADTAQSIYAHSWLVKGRSFTSIGFDMTGKSNSLSKNYRTTTQIAEAAYSLIERDDNIIEDENFVKPSLIDRQGEYPVYRTFKNQNEEMSFVISEIKNSLILKYGLKDIAIITKNKSQLNFVKENLENENFTCAILDRHEYKFDGEGIKLLTMHAIKGLEYKVVIIVGLNDGVIPYIPYKDVEAHDLQETIERKLLYVGMTRANELLYLTSSGKPSKFIAEINPEYLQMSNGSSVKTFYDIHLDDYLFKDRIIDLYSNEEKVRQWFIKELHKSYGYPLSLMDIEYKVSNFSKVGSVDIVVSIYSRNTRLPYIFVELKCNGKGLQNGLEQLKSYMSNSKTCQYGVVTDGNEIVFINKNFEVIEDIPSFNPAMLPSSMQEFNFVDIKNNRRVTFAIDNDYPDEVIVKEEQDEIEYKDDSLKEIKIFSNIAAGRPINMIEGIMDTIKLPSEWFKASEEYFILKVRGDSMIDAGIDNGDLVVIRSQQTAQNREIAAVAIEGDATLKRFMNMGDTVLLISENEKYEPMQIKGNQANILGIAIGIIKKA